MKTKHITRRHAWLLAAFTLLASLSAVHAATNDVGSLLQKGLFEEEANHNLDAAIQAYQSAILQTDKDHQFAATAIFRLGECYRKQGKTNEASAQYQRILREFPDQAELVKLSRSYVGDAALAGNGPQSRSQAVAIDPEAEELNRIKAMIKDNPDLINGRGGQNPLIGAVQQNQLTVARFLLDNKADVNGRGGGNGNGATAIIEAAAQDKKEMVELLLDHGADVNDTSSPNTERFAPLHLAAERGYKSLAEILLARKADVNIKTTSGKTPLHLAAAKGFTAFADLLLAHGADANARDNSGETPLHLAADSGNKAIVELLLAHGADVNAKKTTGETPLHFAVKANRNDVVKLLLDSQADPNVKATVIMRDPPPNQMNSRSYADFAPLTIAAFTGQKIPAELLLAHKADVNTKDSNGYTPLCWSVTKNQPQIAELLLANGADVNAQNDNHWTPLSLAVNGNSPEMVRLILAHQPKVDVLDSQKLTPLQRAVGQGQLQIAELLLNAGADANAFYPSDQINGLIQNPLLRAVGSFNKPMVELLLAHKANPDLQYNSGITPLSLTKMKTYGQLTPQQQNGQPRVEFGQLVPQEQLATLAEIAELLREAGANENLQRLSSIEVSRGNFEQNIFLKGTNSYNHFSLFELIAMVDFHVDLTYNFGGGGGFGGTRESRSALRFPDFTTVKINRLDTNGRTNILNANLESALETGDCSKDMPLQWGDIVEIPESDHKVSENWLGLSQPIQDALTKCLERKVEIIVKGQTTRLTLAPKVLSPGGMPPLRSNIQLPAPASTGMLPSFRLKDVVNRANVLLASSDTTRVKVKRANPATGQTDEMIFNLEKTDPNTDLWLRDGDVIEIPEKP
jgi:ankyrin repeat protein